MSKTNPNPELAVLERILRQQRAFTALGWTVWLLNLGMFAYDMSRHRWLGFENLAAGVVLAAAMIYHHQTVRRGRATLAKCRAMWAQTTDPRTGETTQP